jgi:UDP-N-acetylmuramoylalanine--D-glutamate ligase
MNRLENKDVLVIGLGDRGRAACELLIRRGARVVAVDIADTPDLRKSAEKLKQRGVTVTLGVSTVPPVTFDLAVLSPAVPRKDPLVQQVLQQQIHLISELELGFQQSSCLNLAVAGTNGKSTTAGLIQHILAENHRKTALAGDRHRPLCALADKTRELDCLVLQVNAFQLEQTEFFRPIVAVLTNLAPDHLDRYATAAEYVAAHGGLFRNQQAFDWAVVQSDALAKVRAAGLSLPSKVITFSATDTSAELYVDRGLLISRIPGWSGPLLDIDHCLLRGPHNAENILAALAVGHVLRVPIETMAESVRSFSAGPHRFETVAEIGGVQFINDSKATNLDALSKALLAVRSASGNVPNIWLIAGGRDKGLDYHDAGPLLSAKVKHAFLVGESREKLRAAWSLFTPCTVTDSLVEAVHEAARNAVSGDVVLLSPACSSFDQFRNYQNRGETFCEAVKSISGGANAGTPNMDGEN